jgi:hypothetical protein
VNAGARSFLCSVHCEKANVCADIENSASGVNRYAISFVRPFAEDLSLKHPGLEETRSPHGERSWKRDRFNENIDARLPARVLGTDSELLSNFVLPMSPVKSVTYVSERTHQAVERADLSEKNTANQGLAG